MDDVVLPGMIGRGCIPIGDILTGDIAVGIELRGVYQVEARQIAEKADFGRIRGRFQVLAVSSDEIRLPILWKKVIEENQIPRSPGQNLAADLEIQKIGRTRENPSLADIAVPFFGDTVDPYIPL